MDSLLPSLIGGAFTLFGVLLSQHLQKKSLQKMIVDLSNASNKRENEEIYNAQSIAKINTQITAWKQFRL
ncbi:MAG: hypothetical protein GQ569_00530 [Methylococcaceae bacterium]|nr:hypothetical protein [Methylococcaceae bacterium]